MSSLKFKAVSIAFVLILLMGLFSPFMGGVAFASNILPIEITITVNSATTPKTQVQVATGWVGLSWMSQQGIGRSTYRIGVYPDGTAISLDGQLDLTPWPDVNDQALRVYIRYPDAQHSNGADALLYTKSGNIIHYGNQGYVDFGGAFYTGSLTAGNSISFANSSGAWQRWTPLPQYFLIHTPSITPGTRIQVSSYYAGVKWVSQPILARGDFIIRMDPDGFVRSIDSKLAFSKSGDARAPALAIYILKPDNNNSADYYRYTWSNASTPSGAIAFESSGYIDFNSGAVGPSSTGNTVNLTTNQEVIYPESFMLRVHLESVTRWTFLHMPFYWKHAIYRSQIPLGPGDYWIQVMPDSNPADPASAPYLLSLDNRIRFNRIYCPEAPDPVFGVFIACPNRPEQGFDAVGFVHNFRRPNTYQTMLGENKVGLDVGLGFVFCDVRNPRDAITNHPTTPTETLTGGNYVVVTDAGILIGRVVNEGGAPIAGARVTINGCTQVTDANGEFRFTHMVHDNYVLHYSAPGYRSQDQVVTVAEGAPTYLPQMVLSRL